jgi:hypothetical protein
MKRFRYVIVYSNGKSHDLARESRFYPVGLGADEHFDLSKLLDDGWQPVREIGMRGANDDAQCILVLLEKEDGAPPAATLAQSIKQG